MSPYRPSQYRRRDVLNWIAALPAVAIAAGRLTAPSAAAQAPLPASVTDLVAGNTAFAFDLYAALRDTVDGNLLISPYSVSLALAMTYAGARAETAVQMADVLAFTLPQPQLHETFGGLNADLVARGSADAGEDGDDHPRTLAIANALWLEQTYPFDPAYVDALEPAYGPALHQADFVHRSEEMREEINSWVEEKTDDRIQDIVPPDYITEGTLFAIVNAIYFYGSWQRAFDPADTHDDDFVRFDGTSATVPFMNQQESLPYARGDGYQMVELPYAESALALTVILPDEGRFAEVEAALATDTIQRTTEQLVPTMAQVSLPKFELVFGTIDLVDTLKALGMVDAFTPVADFTGMVEPGALVPPLMPPMIAYVLHKAFIGVDEKGTEVAAATVVLGTPTTSPLRVEIHLDRPFLFAIRDTLTGTILFLGRVLDPTA